MPRDEAIYNLVAAIKRSRCRLLDGAERDLEPLGRRANAKRITGAADDDGLAIVLARERTAVAAGDNTEDEGHAAGKALAVRIEARDERAFPRSEARVQALLGISHDARLADAAKRRLYF